jgi:hypothetical protein
MLSRAGFLCLFADWACGGMVAWYKCCEREIYFCLTTKYGASGAAAREGGGVSICCEMRIGKEFTTNSIMMELWWCSWACW